MKKFLPAFLLFFALSGLTYGQIVLDGSQYQQNFDDIDGEGLASTGFSSDTPTGWAFYETGVTADFTYVAGTGGASVPHTYSFGYGSNIERAFGTLRGTSFSDFVSTIGAEFENGTGGEIAGLQISYSGEQWRSGDAGLTDRLLFYYSTDATGLEDGGATWIPVTDLNFTGPNLTGAGGIDGNLNSTDISFTISGLSIADGETFWIKWEDEDVSPSGFNSEHGLGVDDFSIIPFGGPTTVYLTPETQTVDEGDGQTIIFVGVNNPSLTDPTTVDFSLIGGTGDATDIDNFVSPLQVTIPAGATGWPVFITITDDMDAEGDENLIFGLSNAAGGNSASVGTPDEAELIIQDNDILPEYYRSSGSGNWFDLATWEFSSDNATWVAASEIPDNTVGPIEIQTGHTVTINGTLSVDELTVNGTLVRSVGDFTLTNGAGTDMTVNGRFTHGAALSQPVFTGTVQVNTAGSIEVQNNTNDQSIYGTSTRVTWANDSDLRWNATTSFASGTYFPNNTQAVVPELVILNSTPTFGDATDLLVRGRLRVPLGITATFGGTGTKTFRGGIQVDGTLTQISSGLLRITGTTTSLTGFGDINLDPAGGLQIAQFATVFLPADKTINGGPLIINGSLIFTTGTAKTLTLTHSGPGSVGISGTGTLNIGAVAGHTVEIAAQDAEFPTTLTVGTGSIVDFNSDNLQNIPARNFANLTSSGTGDRVLPNGGTVGVNAAFTPGTNTWTVDGSTVSYNGGAQTVASFDYENILISGSGTKTLGGAANLYGTLNLNNGLTFNTNGNDFTLISTATETASIGVLPATASIVGNVIAQRYMPGEGRIYRYIASQVDQPAVSQLQDDFPVTGNFTGADDIPGVRSDPSLYFYDESQPGTIDDGYVAYPQTDNSAPLENGLGYAAFIREDVAATVIDLEGAPNTHDQTLPVSYTDTGAPADDGWNLVGNPYPAAIDWTNGGWTKVNLDDAVYIRDNGNGGVYASYVNGVGSNGGTGEIASGQAFWVKANAAGPQLEVTEAVKSANNAAEFFRSAPVNIMRLSMSKEAVSDEIVIYFSGDMSNDFVSSEDAYNLPNQVFDLASLTTSGEALSINGLNDSFCQLDIPLQISKMDEGAYTLDLSGLDMFTETVTVQLHDAFSGESIELSSVASYDFNVTADEKTSAADRFSLTLEKGAATPEITVDQGMLEVNYSSGVQWFYNGEEIDGATASTYTPTASGEYSVEISSGTCVLTAAVEYTITGTEEFTSLFRVYPNPTSDYINFNIADRSVGNVRVELLDLRGAHKIVIPEIVPGQEIQINMSSLSSGVYILNVVTDERTFIHRIVRK